MRSLSRSGRHSGAREVTTDAFDLAGIAHVDRAHLHPERRRHGLDDGELADPRGYGGIPKDRYSRHARRDLLEQFQPFPAQAVFELIKPVVLPPGRARLSTKPAPTGSATTANTIGTVRVACSNGPTVEVPGARMTSGASATNSAACLRISTALPWPSGCRSARCGRGPAQLLPAPAGTPRAGLTLRIVSRCGHEHADAPHPLALLRARGERPRAPRRREA